MSSASSEQRQVLNEVCAEILDKIRGILSREEGGDRKVVFDNVRKELMKMQVDYNKVEVKDEWSELMNAGLPSPPARDVDVTSSSLPPDEPMSKQKQILRQQDNDLMQLSQGLETLKSISVSMNESLVEQNKTIEGEPRVWSEPRGERLCAELHYFVCVFSNGYSHSSSSPMVLFFMSQKLIQRLKYVTRRPVASSVVQVA